MFNKKIIFSIRAAIFIFILASSMLYANGDDDHSNAGSEAEANPEQYAEGYTGKFEIVVTLENIKPNERTTQKIYLSDFLTNTPVENAMIQLEITGVDNSKITLPVQIEPGVYEFSVEFPEIKKYDFLFNIISGDVDDLVAINAVDLAQSELTDVTNTTAEKSFLLKALENWPWIVLSILMITLIAFIFYRIGKSSKAKMNLPTTLNPPTKYEA